MSGTAVAFSRLLALLTVCYVANGAVAELDGDTFRAALGDPGTDVFVIFHRTANGDEVASVADHVSAKIKSTSIKIATYNVDTFGLPMGMHMKNHDLHPILFPAGGRNSRMYDWEADEWSITDIRNTKPDNTPCTGSTCPGYKDSLGHHHHHHGEQCNHDHSHDHNHDHDHHHHHGDLHLSPLGILQFLHEHSTFPMDVSKPTLADKWRGRDMFPAIVDGLTVVKAQLDALTEENAKLHAEVSALRRKLSACTSQQQTQKTEL